MFCGRHLLASQLRQANIDASAGSVAEVGRIVARIRARWPRVRILLRADSGFAREALMAWCENNAVDYRTIGANAGYDVFMFKRSGAHAVPAVEPGDTNAQALWGQTYAIGVDFRQIGWQAPDHERRDLFDVSCTAATCPSTSVIRCGCSCRWRVGSRGPPTVTLGNGRSGRG